MAFNVQDALFNIRGPFAGYTTNKERTGEKPLSEKAQDAIEEIITGPFDIVVWLKNNWQAAIVIAVCILILTRK